MNLFDLTAIEAILNGCDSCHLEQLNTIPNFEDFVGKMFVELGRQYQELANGGEEYTCYPVIEQISNIVLVLLEDSNCVDVCMKHDVLIIIEEGIDCHLMINQVGPFWMDGVSSLLRMVYTLVGVNAAITEYIFTTMPSLFEKIFDICENHTLTQSLAKEYHYLLLNLVNINDDEALDQMLDTGIIRAFLSLIGDVRYGHEVTIDVLETF